jgi:hypothetical protein
MSDEQTALARRAVACPKWRLMPGMLTDEGRRVMQVWPDNLGIKWSHLLDNRVVRDADALPDLSDPATLGCLLALVRKAWGRDDLGASRYRERWCVERWCGDIRVFQYGTQGDTEAEALVAALEGAP